MGPCRLLPRPVPHTAPPLVAPASPRGTFCRPSGGLTGFGLHELQQHARGHRESSVCLCTFCLGTNVESFDCTTVSCMLSLSARTAYEDWTTESGSPESLVSSLRAYSCKFLKHMSWACVLFLKHDLSDPQSMNAIRRHPGDSKSPSARHFCDIQSSSSQALDHLNSVYSFYVVTM